MSIGFFTLKEHRFLDIKCTLMSLLLLGHIGVTLSRDVKLCFNLLIGGFNLLACLNTTFERGQFIKDYPLSMQSSSQLGFSTMEWIHTSYII